MENNNQASSEVNAQWLADTYRREFVVWKMYAVRRIHNEMEAEEIVGQSFAALVRQICDHPNKFPSGAHAKAYLYRTIKNSCHAWLRKNRSVKVGEPAEAIMDDHHLVLEFEKRDLLEHLLSLIDQLPGQLQQVAMLFFIEGLTSEEVEKRLRLNKEVLRIYRFRAVSKLRDMVYNRKNDEKLPKRPVSNLL